MNIEVKDCNNCPFASLDSADCIYCAIDEDKAIIETNEGNLIHPDWCPLKTQEVIVKLTNK